jgi:hypothetical protein
MKSKTEIENNNIKQNCKQRTQHTNQKKLAGPVKYKWWKRFPRHFWHKCQHCVGTEEPVPVPEPEPAQPVTADPRDRKPEYTTPARLKELVNFSRLYTQVEGFSPAVLRSLGLNPADLEEFYNSWEF